LQEDSAGNNLDDRPLNRTIRLVVLGAVGLFALTAAGAALAKDYQPSLWVTPGKYALGAKTGMGIILQHGECCFAPGRLTVYSPPGYGVKLEHPAGTRIGTLIGEIRAGETELMAFGFITAESPLNHVSNSCAPGSHDAVWMVEFEAAPYRFRVPMYVDRVTTGPEAAYSSARMVICFASPYVSPPQGAPERIAIGDTALGVGDVFTNPTSAGTHAWNAVFVPYTPGTATLSTELTAQSTSYVRLPVALDLTVKRLRRGGTTFVITVCLRENGQVVRGARVRIFGRPRPSGAFTRFGHGVTDARGCITRRLRPRSKVILGEVLVEPSRRAAGGCSAALAARCSRPTIASLFLTRAFRIRL
jgi:hypothetical protein